MTDREPRWVVRAEGVYGCAFCEESAEYDNHDIDIEGFHHMWNCPTRGSFAKWFETFLSEKGVNEDQVFDLEANGLVHSIPVSVVIEHIYITSAKEKAAIKDMIVKIDFHNGNVAHYFEHLAQVIANQYAGVLA